MNLPSFDEFKKTISQDVINDICDKCNELSAKTDGLGNKLAVQNYLMSMCLLEKYHNWLSEQL